MIKKTIEDQDLLRHLDEIPEDVQSGSSETDDEYDGV